MENARIKVSTIEPWDGTAVYGSSKHHMVAGIGSLGEHARPAMFDVIIINGVMGEAISAVLQLPGILTLCACCTSKGFSRRSCPFAISTSGNITQIIA